MKIEKGKTYYIKAKAKGMVFFPNSKYFTDGQLVEGNIEGATLKVVEHALDIIEIKEFKSARDEQPKVKEEKVIVPEPSDDKEKEFEEMLRED